MTGLILKPLARNDYATPQEFFDLLDAEFHFTLDVCATVNNAKCKTFFSPAENGLRQDWGENVCWMNPPYGRGIDVYQWVQKAYKASKSAVVVCLLRSSTETKWFHDFCLRANEIRFIKDRLHFEGRANHANMIVVFRNGGGIPVISSISNGRAERRILKECGGLF